MAITRKNRVGRVRIKLAGMLHEALTKEYGFPVDVDPSDLESQNPYYSRAEAGCCLWTGLATTTDRDTGAKQIIHLASWAKMSEVIREPIGIIRDHHGDAWSIEIA